MAYHRSFYGIGSVTGITADSPAQAIDLAIVRGVSVEFKMSGKPLKGNTLFPVDYAASDASITGKIQSADFYAQAVALVIPGTTTVPAATTPRKKMALHSATAAASITVTNSATWVTDLGAINITTGKTMKRVASAPAANEYSVSAGIYTLNVAESGTVAIRYLYTENSTGVTLTASNPSVGATTAFGLYVSDPAGGTRESVLYFPAVRFENLSLAMKSDDWTETGLDFTAFADASGVPFYAYGNE